MRSGTQSGLSAVSIPAGAGIPPRSAAGLWRGPAGRGWGGVGRRSGVSPRQSPLPPAATSLHLPLPTSAISMSHPYARSNAVPLCAAHLRGWSRFPPGADATGGPAVRTMKAGGASRLPPTPAPAGAGHRESPWSNPPQSRRQCSGGKEAQ